MPDFPKYIVATREVYYDVQRTIETIQETAEEGHVVTYDELFTQVQDWADIDMCSDSDRLDIALAISAVAGIGYGKYESAKYDAYVAKVEAQAKEQELINKAKAKEAAQVTEKVKNDYQNKLDILKRTYSGMRLPGTSQTGSVSGTASTTDGTPADPKFIEKCAITTQQLVSLQAWLNEQIGIFNAKY